MKPSSIPNVCSGEETSRLRWLRGAVFPTVALWLYVVAWVICNLSLREKVSPIAAMAEHWADLLIITAWVMADARKRRHVLWYDFGLFVWVCLPITVPIYLFQTRGWRALITLAWFVAMWVLAFSVLFLLHKFGVVLGRSDD